MSRIHEALKKAAQERSAQLAASTEPSFLEVADAPRLGIPLRELEEPALRLQEPLEAPAYIRYEDVRVPVEHQRQVRERRGRDEDDSRLDQLGQEVGRIGLRHDHQVGLDAPWCEAGRRAIERAAAAGQAQRDGIVVEDLHGLILESATAPRKRKLFL